MGFNTGLRGTNVRYPGGHSSTLSVLQGRRPALHSLRCSSWQHSRVTAGSCTHQSAQADFVCRRSCFFPVHISSEAPHPQSPRHASEEAEDQRGRRISPGHTAGRQSWEAPGPDPLFLSHTLCPLTCTKCSTFLLSASPSSLTPSHSHLSPATASFPQPFWRRTWGPAGATRKDGGESRGWIQGKRKNGKGTGGPQLEVTKVKGWRSCGHRGARTAEFGSAL